MENMQGEISYGPAITTPRNSWIKITEDLTIIIGIEQLHKYCNPYAISIWQVFMSVNERETTNPCGGACLNSHEALFLCSS
jgi:hypothetical protein